MPWDPLTASALDAGHLRPLGLCFLTASRPCRGSLSWAPLPIGVHRGRQQGVCGGVRLARHPVQRTVRGPLPPGYLSRPALHCPQTGGDRPAGGSQVRVTRRHRKGEARTDGWGRRRRQGACEGHTGSQAMDGPQAVVGSPPAQSGMQWTDWPVQSE